MHTLRLLLNTTNYDKEIINKRFFALSHIHNVLVKHAKKLLKRLEADTQYQNCLKEYTDLLKKEKPTKEEVLKKKELPSTMKDIRENLGLTESSFQSYIKVCAKRYKKCLSSQQVQKEATRVWSGVKAVLFRNGEEIHFKKNRDFSTIGGKSNLNGVKFDKDTNSIEWIGLNITCKIPKKNASYIYEALKDKISYCEIERKMFPNGWHYYVILYLQGNAPKKIVVDDKRKGKTMGIDIGTSTIAAVSEDMVLLQELAPDTNPYNKKIRELLYRMDISKRNKNPQKYNQDGTINKADKSKWKFSKNYFKNRDRLKSLYRQKSDYIKQCHEQLCNELIKNSETFIIENMSFCALQKRAKKTERQDEVSEVISKDGTVKSVYKYKKKKRFGKSLNNKAPAAFVKILEYKSKLYGGALIKVDTAVFKASQYCHDTDTYQKCKLSERNKTINHKVVQRDLYSAFLLKNADESLKKPDRDKCFYEFNNFVQMCDKHIQELKSNGITNKKCFGF